MLESMDGHYTAVSSSFKIRLKLIESQYVNYVVHRKMNVENTWKSVCRHVHSHIYFPDSLFYFYHSLPADAWI